MIWMSLVYQSVNGYLRFGELKEDVRDVVVKLSIDSVFSVSRFTDLLISSDFLTYFWIFCHFQISSSKVCGV